MVKHSKLIFCLILGVVCAQTSCDKFISYYPPGKWFSAGSSPPPPVTNSHNTETVNIDVFIIRLAPQQNELVQQLWQETDEQSLPPQLRRELLAQGFRAGVIGDLLPPSLARLLHVSSEGKPETNRGDFQEFSMADITREATVTRQSRSLLPEMHALIKIFDEQNALPECSLFWKENGAFVGQTYRETTGLFVVSGSVNKDGSAQIRITPELEHGVLERRFRMVSGMLVPEESRPRHSFESLTFSQTLMPGQWIILGITTPDSAGAGKAFFTRKNAVLEQRLVAIRLVQAAQPFPAGQVP